MSKLICIDAGHGGTDSGAVGNGVIEKNITLKTALNVGTMLKKQGFDVIFTRVADNFVSLSERCRIANNKMADLFVSIHVNSAGNKDARGTETLCYSKNRLAETVQKCLIDSLKTKNRGVKERKDLAVLNGTKMTAILVETAFLSNTEEAKLLKNDTFLNNTAEAIVKGICTYSGVKYKGLEKEKEKETAAALKTKTIDVVIDSQRNYTEGYFTENKNLFTADFIKSLGFKVGYDTKTKQVIVNPAELKLNVDGVEKVIKTININGFNYCPLRSIENVIGTFKIMKVENGKIFIKTESEK